MMQVDSVTGRIDAARWLASPNCDDRPPGVAPELLVVHGISLPPAEYGGRWIDDFFCNRLDGAAHPYFADIAELKVSAHLLIRRNGVLVQYVALHRRAWHAGESCFAGRAACNDFSIGVELEGCDEAPYCAAQYRALAQVYLAIVEAYPQVGARPVVGHSDIAPGRKTDPGPAFDWSQFDDDVHRLGGTTQPRSADKSRTDDAQ